MLIVYIISITQLAPVNNITDILRLWLPNRLRVQPVIQYMLYDSRHTHQCNLDILLDTGYIFPIDTLLFMQCFYGSNLAHDS